MKKVRFQSLWAPHFFGLTPNNFDVVLEQIYILVYHIGFSYKDAYNLPVWKREWFLNKFLHDMKVSSEANKNGSHAPSRKSSRGNKIFSKAF